MSLRTHIASLVVVALGLCAAIALGMGAVQKADSVQSLLSPAAASPGVSPYPYRFLLNALLLPALDPDATPPRWVDPRPALGCGPDSEVRVNGAPLVPGARVPDAPFELEWKSDGCHPFGRGGPRFDGHVQLTVARENWGYSAMIAPSDMRVASGKAGAAWLEAGAASMPLCVDRNEPDQAIAGPDVVIACR